MAAVRAAFEVEDPPPPVAAEPPRGSARPAALSWPLASGGGGAVCGSESCPDARRGSNSSTPVGPMVSELVLRVTAAPRKSVMEILAAPAPTSATFGGTVFSMVKQMLGAGVLSMGDAYKLGSVGPGFLGFASIGVVSLSTMLLVADLSEIYEASSYRELWGKTVDTKSAPLVDACIFLNSVFGCISFCLLIGSWLTQSLSNLLGNSFSNKALNTMLTAIPLFVMVLQKDLYAFRHSSMVGVVCVFLGLFFVLWQLGMHWADDDIASRSCGSIAAANCTSAEVLRGHMWRPSWDILETVNLGAGMMMMHYNIPKFHSEYSSANTKSFRAAILTAFTIAASFATMLGIAALLRFGTTMPPGNVLKHFEKQFQEKGGDGEPIMNGVENHITNVTWLIMAASIIMSFPLLFLPLRSSFLQLWRSVLPGTPSLERLDPHIYMALTLGLMAPLVAAGIFVDSLTTVSKLKGAICGMSLSIMLPAVIKFYDLRKQMQLSARTVGVDSKIFLPLGFIFLVGLSLMIRGLVKGLASAFA